MYGKLTVTVCGQKRTYPVQAGRATFGGAPEALRPDGNGAWAWRRVPRSQVERIIWDA